MSKQENTNHEMMVVSFADENRAGEVLETLKQMEDTAVADLKSAAVVVKDASGKVTIKETRDFDAKQGAMAWWYRASSVRHCVVIQSRSTETETNAVVLVMSAMLCARSQD